MPIRIIRSQKCTSEAVKWRICRIFSSQSRNSGVILLVTSVTGGKFYYVISESQQNVTFRFLIFNPHVAHNPSLLIEPTVTKISEIMTLQGNEKVCRANSSRKRKVCSEDLFSPSGAHRRYEGFQQGISAASHPSTYKLGPFHSVHQNGEIGGGKDGTRGLDEATLRATGHVWCAFKGRRLA